MNCRKDKNLINNEEPETLMLDDMALPAGHVLCGDISKHSVI